MRLDWDRAFVWWVEGGRTYSDVARELECTKRSVERNASKRGWQDRRAEIERKARAEADKRLVRSKTDRDTDTLRLIDAARTKFASQLRLADFRLTGSDFVGLIKLEQLLEGAATERIDPGHVQQVLAVVLRLATQGLPRDEFLAEFDRVVAGVLTTGSEEGEEA